MKKNIKLFAFTLPVIIGFSSFWFIAGRNAGTPDQSKEEVIQALVANMLKEIHYNPPAIDDGYSHRAFDLYISRVDYQKMIFLQSDIDELKKYYNILDDGLQKGDIGFFNASFEILTKRLTEDQASYRAILSNPFDFKTKETIELDPEKVQFPKDVAAMKDAWRKYLKYQVMTRFVEMKDNQDKAIADNKPELIVKTDAELEAQARAKLLKIQEDVFDRLIKIKKDERFADYVNVLVGLYDPHSEFFPPIDKSNFDIRMSGKLEGIGAQLEEKEGYIRITNIVPGSPSWKDGRLKAGDVFLKVGQGDNEPVDIVGMGINDAIKLIRGSKGTEVRLTVKKPDGSIQVVILIRDVIVLEETYAQSAVVKKDGKNIGYLRLNSFYADFEDPRGRRCAKDVKVELEKLKAENVDGIIFDLRDNGGGSLSDAVDIVGLFIPQGPVVQVRSLNNEITSFDDRDIKTYYEGPLVVMINEYSASASEIFASAIQDYKRGIIAGSKASFGKGTVQRFYEMDKQIPAQYASFLPLGSLKITCQKFYRVSGGSTQLKGVASDVVLPDLYENIEVGEKEQDFPMAWDEIKPQPISLWKNAPDYNAQKIASQKRVENDPAFSLIGELAKELKSERDNTLESLNIDDYRAELKKREANKDKYKLLEEEVKTISISALDADLKEFGADTVKTERKNAWLGRIRKDIYVNEVAAMINGMK